MPQPDQPEAPGWPGRLLPLWVVLAALVAPVWFIAPLGLGFAPWPPGLRGDAARVALFVSWFGGLPLLAVGQVTGIVLASRGQRRRGGRVAFLSLAVFAALVAVALLLMS